MRLAWVCVFLLVLTLGLEPRGWAKPPVTTSLRSDLATARAAVSIRASLAAIEQEQASIRHAADTLRHASAEGVRKLTAYRAEAETHGGRARARGRALYKLARGGLLRLVLEHARDRAHAADRIVRGRTIRWLIRHDVRELEIQRGAGRRARAELLASVREQQALQALRTMQQMQAHALSSLDESLRKRLRRRGLADGVPPGRSSADNTQRTLVQTLRRLQRPVGFGVLADGLTRPVPGDIVGRYGSYRDPQSKLPMARHGLELAARRHQAVRAAADGTVVFAGRSPGKEQVVVIDHGHGYRTLTGRLVRLKVEQGQSVAAGALLGKVAPQVLGEDAVGETVYFELRHGERPLDPTRHLR